MTQCVFPLSSLDDESSVERIARTSKIGDFYVANILKIPSFSAVSCSLVITEDHSES